MTPSYASYPFLRIVLPFMAGITCFEFLPVYIPVWIYMLILLPITFCVFFISKITVFYTRRNTLQGVGIFLYWMVAGYALPGWQHPVVQIPSLENAEGVICTIMEDPVPKTRSFKTEARVEGAYINGSWVKIDKGIMIYSPLANKKPWSYDDMICIRSKVVFPAPPSNPNQFNYKKYLEKKDIFYQAYVKENEYIITGKDDRFTLSDLTQPCIRYTNHVFYSLVPDSDLAAISTALLIGYQEELDPETKTNFSRVGAMHILAVSGLHVAIIFVLLSKMLFFLDKNTWGKVLKTIILILFLWGYAFIAGFSPSVIRAAFMFTILIPIVSFRMHGNIYNNIFSSAFLLLVMDTRYLFDVGFQLSYAAVVGIIYLFPMMENWVRSRYWLVNQAWQLTGVSIAAQLFTTPIVLYYFGQFPLSFLLSNIVAVPVSTGIIYVGLAALIFFRVPVLSAIIGKILHLLLIVLKRSIDIIESLPYSFTDHLLMNRFQAFLLFFIFTGIFIYFRYRKVRHLQWVLMGICIFMVTMIHRRIQVMNHHEFIIYNLNKTYYMEFISGRHAVNIMQHELSEMNKGLFIRTYHQHAGVFYTDSLHADMKIYEPGFSLRSTDFYIITGYVPQSEKVLETDYLILSDIKFLDIEKLVQGFRFKQIILLNNHSRKKIQKLEQLLEEAGLNFHSISSDGYFSAKL